MGHNNIQRSTNVNRNRRRRVRPRSNTCTNDAHDPVQADRDAVAGAAVGGGQDLGRVGVEGSVVYVLLECTSAAEGMEKMEEEHLEDTEGGNMMSMD
jgi:hypothetical protein